ncbi:MAG: 2-succinyl-5-enolpyruvyl-6-hydroxy-3-cyclohexene-1-carboxylic-acid synthase [Flavobacteriales bacterium]|jgi:2-succinyl-5-enolpyruvyl-6-hydroxy-3-cyclohexene-1-carboxylate synthase|nr:2-succinyl-5-enolpyruvyl-6-hydroxy-3-cyclohexene-1-carboxylic-acid synthase [Flavobacteriales bacterium]
MSTSDHHSAAALARLCAAKGVRHAVISPGSRNAPLVIAFTAQDGITCHQVIDERSAAFFALGMAQQLHAPVALICTSGSAVLNYAPAVAEAFYQRVPLLVITADRPAEWTDQGEGQAIRQENVLGPHVRQSVQLPRDAHDELARWHCDRLVNVAIDATLLPVPGPVQVNVPFNEPLYGQAPGQADRGSRTIAQVLTGSFILPEHARWLVQQLSTARKVLVLAGQGVWSRELRGQLKQLAALPQVAVLTEATANLDDNAFITCIDRVIEGIDDSNEKDLRPELLITFGGAVVSKRIKGLLRKWQPAHHWNVDVGQRHFDTYRSLTHDIATDPEIFFAQVAASVRPAEETFYAEAWRMVDRRTTERHHRSLASAPWCDLTVFQEVLGRIPPGTDVQLGNSTVVRYAQLFERPHGHRFFGNRGTSGIDGCVSTAVGAAWASQRPTTLITGETAFLYDSNAFWNKHLSPLLKVIVIDNGGGNIFRFIEGPDRDPALLKWFEAPHGRDPMALVKSFGLPAHEATDMAGLRTGMDRLHAEHDQPAVLVVRTPAEVGPKVLRDYFKGLRG